MDDFTFSLAISAVAVLLAMAMVSDFGFSPIIALFLLAGSQAGFFALSALHKAGLPTPRAEYLFMAAVFVCFLSAALALGASLRAILSFAALPLVLSAPAIGALAKSYFS